MVIRKSRGIGDAIGALTKDGMRRDECYCWRKRGGGINVSILLNEIKNDDFLFLISSFCLSFVSLSLTSHGIKLQWNPIAME